MPQFVYTLESLRVHKTDYGVKAASLEEAKALVAEDKYCGEYLDSDDYFCSDYDPANPIKLNREPEWDTLDESKHYPLIVLHKHNMFTLKSADDIGDALQQGFINLTGDLHDHIAGKETRFVYVKPNQLTPQMEGEV